MLKKAIYATSIAAVVGSVFFVSASKNEPMLSSHMQASVVSVNAQGKESLRAVKQAAPGQTIQYDLTYANNSDKSFKGLVVTGPIPAHTHYLANTATTGVSAMRMVSIDGGKTFEKEPVKRQQKMADGTVKTVVIPATKYTHIRWEASDALISNDQQQYTYRVKVN
ncbi:MAG TPA: DUF11 domain-containing protein [Leucothrix mucor]|uniref:DUF11 domain-containing protein n=1 Tax=Leucothrix mucor TaxID=45248 RepID=A0A7V2WUN9_LEUMU|nr:DUF11 domain-containing protein [Leucothrix mucor]